MFYRIPSVIEIYGEYHRQTMFAQYGFYPKPLSKSRDESWLKPNLVEQLKKFQGLLERNREAIDWKLYITAIAQYYKGRFDPKILSNLNGIKIYRNFVQNRYGNKDNEQEIYDQIINTLVFLSGYLKVNELTFKQYLDLDRDTIPVMLKHIYSGSISLYFLAAFDPYKVSFQFLNYPNDLFLEYFSVNKDEFMEKYIMDKHKEIIKYEKIRQLIEKLQKTFK